LKPPHIDFLKDFMEEKYLAYNNPSFIETDPIAIPRSLTEKKDIEIAAFMTATIAWGNRKSILKDSWHLLQLMDNHPYSFLLGASENEMKQFSLFVHRTFNGTDCRFFLESLRNIYRNHGGLETQFQKINLIGVKESIMAFRDTFLELPHQKHVEKHLSDPSKGSPAKRINLFLRWMIRKDNHGVDFGLWKMVNSSNLICPLDVHVSRVARKLGLLERKSNDWEAACELTANLRKFDSSDPVKYDFALFGLGVFEKFQKTNIRTRIIPRSFSV